MSNLKGKRWDHFGELQRDKAKAVFLKMWSSDYLSQNHLGVIFKPPVQGQNDERISSRVC